MNIEEYHIKLLDILRANELAIQELIKEYCEANNQYELGDLVMNSNNIRIRIDDIGVLNDRTLPQCIYKGVIVNKNGTPNKKGKITTIYQAQVIKSWKNEQGKYHKLNISDK